MRRTMTIFGAVLLSALVIRMFTGPVNLVQPGQFIRIEGLTMGTTYKVVLFGDTGDLGALQTDVLDELQRINKIMSTYDPESELSKVNCAGTDALVLSDELSTVLAASLDLAEKSGGTFDPTVGPLVNLWGFGPEGRKLQAPDEQVLEQTRALVGYQKLQLNEVVLNKEHGGLQLDLGGIAKGYGVDCIFQVLLNHSCSNALVEIGGETRSMGSKDGQPWRIGVQQPDYKGGRGNELAAVMNLGERAMATSGDYENFFEGEDGKYYAHIIDPRTGRPAGHAVGGVSVLADTCMLADGLATALYVLGPEEGLVLLQQYPGTEALFILREDDGSFTQISSPGFSASAE